MNTTRTQTWVRRIGFAALTVAAMNCQRRSDGPEANGFRTQAPAAGQEGKSVTSASSTPGSAEQAKKTENRATPKVNAPKGQVMEFEANVGQSPSTDGKFISTGQYYVAALDADAVSLHAPGVAITQKLVGAKRTADGHGVEKSGVTHYYRGKKALPNIDLFRKVQFDEVYPKIDVVYRGNGLKLESDFIVKPGGDPANIRMGFDDATVTLEGGVLHVSSKGAQFDFDEPHVFQKIAGKEKVVEGHYVLARNDDVRFEVGAYDHRYPLVIDPSLTFMKQVYPYDGTNGVYSRNSMTQDPNGTNLSLKCTTPTDCTTNIGRDAGLAGLWPSQCVDWSATTIGTTQSCPGGHNCACGCVNDTDCYDGTVGTDGGTFGGVHADVTMKCVKPAGANAGQCQINGATTKSLDATPQLLLTNWWTSEVANGYVYLGGGANMNGFLHRTAVTSDSYSYGYEGTVERFADDSSLTPGAPHYRLIIDPMTEGGWFTVMGIRKDPRNTDVIIFGQAQQKAAISGYGTPNDGLPLTSGTYHPSVGTDTTPNVFVCRLHADLTIVNCTWVGGSGVDRLTFASGNDVVQHRMGSNKIDVDTSGRPGFTFMTTSTWNGSSLCSTDTNQWGTGCATVDGGTNCFNLNVNADNHRCLNGRTNGNSSGAQWDMGVMVLSADLSRAEYAAYYGGQGDERGHTFKFAYKGCPSACQEYMLIGGVTTAPYQLPGSPAPYSGNTTDVWDTAHYTPTSVEYGFDGHGGGGFDSLLVKMGPLHFDANTPPHIDQVPPVVWWEDLGSGGDDSLNAIAVDKDANGNALNIVLQGHTKSSSWVTWQAGTQDGPKGGVDEYSGKVDFFGHANTSGYTGGPTCTNSDNSTNACSKESFMALNGTGDYDKANGVDCTSAFAQNDAKARECVWATTIQNFGGTSAADGWSVINNAGGMYCYNIDGTQSSTLEPNCGGGDNIHISVKQHDWANRQSNVAVLEADIGWVCPSGQTCNGNSPSNGMSHELVGGKVSGALYSGDGNSVVIPVFEWNDTQNSLSAVIRAYLR